MTRRKEAVTFLKSWGVWFGIGEGDKIRDALEYYNAKEQAYRSGSPLIKHLQSDSEQQMLLIAKLALLLNEVWLKEFVESNQKTIYELEVGEFTFSPSADNFPSDIDFVGMLTSDTQYRQFIRIEFVCEVQGGTSHRYAWYRCK